MSTALDDHVARAVAAASDRLREATRTAVPCRPVRDLLVADGGLAGLAAAYEVQRVLIAERVAAGARQVGRKVGLTSLAVQRQLGVDAPDSGVLLDDMAYEHGSRSATTGLLQPRIEAEIAFVLGADLTDDASPESVRAATEYVVSALEICDSRIAGWDITLLDTVADNASSAGFVLGPERHELGAHDLRPLAMQLSRDGEVVSVGSGEDCLGDPVLAVAWLAATARDLGTPLRAGDVVLSGALGPMVPILAGATYRAELGALGFVEISFEAIDIALDLCEQAPTSRRTA